ncbi:MAG: hypothetical protein NTX45_23620 [Proteobacteria bacterium]|nr:hypothetical protein [Pseudomonadota bacterium]
MNRLMKCCFLTFVLPTQFVLVGCQMNVPIDIYKEDIIKPNTRTDSKLTILSKAKDARSQAPDQVGRHTISLLMVPGITVSAEPEEHLDEAIVNRLNESLSSVGYNVSLVDRVKDSNSPVLVVQIDDLRNYLFSWGYPLGIVWGKMELSLHLMSPHGTELWKANLEGHGGIMASLIYMSGFGTRVKSDLTANINQAIEAISSEEFRKALQSKEN